MTYNLKMDSQTPKICPNFVQFCIQEFRSLISQRRRTLKYVEVSPEESAPSIYDMAKEQETKARNLRNALNLYTKAALNGEKVNSCIKDFASVLHQGGFTSEAISFLEEMRVVYKGDAQKYNKLIINLCSQVRPTGKHEYRNILIDLVDIKLQDAQAEILDMFGNSSRIKSISFFENLGFEVQVRCGRFAVLSFDSFSAAKKTMETFKEEEWFGANKYWLDSELYVVAESIDAKSDFEKGMLLNKGKVYKLNGREIRETPQIKEECIRYKKMLGAQGFELVNETSIFLIDNWTKFFEKEDFTDQE